jgi:hypothetical protein
MVYDPSPALFGLCGVKISVSLKNMGVLMGGADLPIDHPIDWSLIDVAPAPSYVNVLDRYRLVPADRARAIAQKLVDKWMTSVVDDPSESELIPPIAIACARETFSADISDTDWFNAALGSFETDLGYSVSA